MILKGSIRDEADPAGVGRRSVRAIGGRIDAVDFAEQPSLRIGRIE